jgi:hypothetical protein
VHPAIVSKTTAHSALHTIFCESPFLERTYDCLLALATAGAIMKLEVIQPISRSNQPQGKMGVYTTFSFMKPTILVCTQKYCCCYTSFRCRFLRRREMVCRLMVLLVAFFLRQHVLYRFSYGVQYSQKDLLSLSIQKKNKIQGSRVDVDMAGVVPCSSSFPTHPLFPILPRIISHSHKAL